MKKTAQVVLINNEGFVLGVSRKTDHNDFGLPGGKMDAEDLDNPETTAIREIKEETGLDITDLNLVFAIHKDGYMGYTYIAKYTGEIDHNEPHVVKWVPFETLIAGSFGRYNRLVSESLDDMNVKYIKALMAKPSMKTITFTKTKLPYGWLGNMSPYSIRFGEDIYRTSEALFQALRFSDNSIKALIREEKSPMGAKFIAKARVPQMTVEPLSEQDVNNMKMCLRLKLSQHMELVNELLNTEDALIIEDVTKRGDKGSNLFWGAMLVDDKWVGKNMLGNIWMELRKDLQKS
jgi:predicted NAD-dependent protein-ADP-ribosyltransferase YbiA (DUF1768 family)/8-oxo-dGTP pyrophosphatase MutT (NUDIX family)